MQTSFISTRTLRAAPRVALGDHQSGLARAMREIATGRHDDTGLALGSATGRAVDLRIEDTRLSRYVVSNGLVDARMEQTQRVLDDVLSRADDVLQALTALPPSSTAVSALVIEARDALDNLLAHLNTSDGRVFLFGGVNAAERPLADYDAAPAAAVDAALTAAFGAATVPPGATPAQMATFLAGDFANVFSPAGWAGAWSAAADRPLDAEIERGRVVDASVSANREAFRELAMGYTMLADLDLETIRSDTRQVVIDTAVETLGDAVADVVALKAELGLAQRTVEEATGRHETELSIVRQRLEAFEGVDPAEAKTRADTLTTQIEMSYALTARIARLSILDFA